MCSIAPPRPSWRLLNSLMRWIITNCTGSGGGCWGLNPGLWACCTTEPHPQPLALFCKLGLGVRAKLWEAEWLTLGSLGESHGSVLLTPMLPVLEPRTAESQKGPHISISRNWEFSSHCGHVKSSCSKTITWEIFQKGGNRRQRWTGWGVGWWESCVQSSVERWEGEHYKQL